MPTCFRIFRVRRCAAAWLGVVLTASAFGGGWSLPPVSGELSGEFAAGILPGAPRLHWTVIAPAAKAGRRTLQLHVDGPGTVLTAELEIAEPSGEGTWRITGGEIEAGPWFAAAAAKAGGTMAGIAAEGRVEISGNGTWSPAGPSGEVRLAWRGGALRHAMDGWALEGLSLEATLAIDAGGRVRSAAPAELVVRTITTTRFGARNFRATASLNDDGTLSLRRAGIEIAGGEIEVAPAMLPLNPLSLDLRLLVKNVGLQDVAALVPEGLSESRGRVDGGVQIRWSAADGLQLGEGNLVLGATEPAIVRLAPSPGFLTSRVPREFMLLPAWLGPIARWFRPENPAYGEMRDIEAGRTVLRVERLSVQLTPEGDREGRTARVRLVARSSQPQSVLDELTIDVNVAGPLAQVLRLGMNQSFSVSTH